MGEHLYFSVYSNNQWARNRPDILTVTYTKDLNKWDKIQFGDLNCFEKVFTWCFFIYVCGFLFQVCIKVTIINFTVTKSGLEDQLLRYIDTHGK